MPKFSATLSKFSANFKKDVDNNLPALVDLIPAECKEANKAIVWSIVKLNIFAVGKNLSIAPANSVDSSKFVLHKTTCFAANKFIFSCIVKFLSNVSPKRDIAKALALAIASISP